MNEKPAGANPAGFFRTQISRLKRDLGSLVGDQITMSGAARLRGICARISPSSGPQRFTNSRQTQRVFRDFSPQPLLEARLAALDLRELGPFLIQRSAALGILRIDRS